MVITSIFYNYHSLLEKWGRTHTSVDPSRGRAKAGLPARTYIQQLCADTGCILEDLPGAMVNRDGW